MTKEADKIRVLNDAFRTTFKGGGEVVVTRGVAALEYGTKSKVLKAVREFNTFNEDNDPYGEHDFGAFDIDGNTFFWKIDCYDLALEQGSEDPTNPDITTRVLTIMLAEEY